MYSLPRYSYQVVTILLDHMDKSLRCGTEIRTGMVDVLSEVVSIAAVEGVCISVLDISNSLIKHLKESINFEIMVGDAEAMTREKLLIVIWLFLHKLIIFVIKIVFIMFVVEASLWLAHHSISMFDLT